MTNNLEISREVYVWCHFAVILVHLGFAVTLIYLYFSKFEARTIRLICLIFGCVLAIISILALIPIFMDYEDIRDLLIIKE
jgi:low temperature requirement protein LtrA